MGPSEVVLFFCFQSFWASHVLVCPISRCNKTRGVITEHNEIDLCCVFPDIKEAGSCVEIGGIDGFLWQRLCGHNSLAADGPDPEAVRVRVRVRVREWGKCGLGCRTSPGGCKQPCFIVLPVLLERCHYCLFANYPHGLLGCRSLTSLPPHTLSAFHPLFLSSALLIGWSPHWW